MSRERGVNRKGPMSFIERNHTMRIRNPPLRLKETKSDQKSNGVNEIVEGSFRQSFLVQVDLSVVSTQPHKSAQETRRFLSLGTAKQV